MTTTISKHDSLKQQQSQQQKPIQQQLLQKQMQQQNNCKNMQKIRNLDESTTSPAVPITEMKIETIPEIHLDSNTRNTTTIIETRRTPTLNILTIDSINNNNVEEGGDRRSCNNNIITPHDATGTTTTSTTTTLTEAADQGKFHKKKSILNFKSFDFHLKSLYTGLRNGNTHKIPQSHSSTLQSSTTNDSNVNMNEQVSGQLYHPFNRMPPYLKIESVNNEEAENLLVDYAQSPYSTRRNSALDDHQSSTRLLQLSDPHHLQQPYHLYGVTQSQASSPSPYFLSPHVFDTSLQTIRRSSTSDIVAGGGKRSVSSSTQSSRRPSTSDLLRRARERRGNESRMGRSVSHSGLPRGGGGSMGYRPSSGRRTSMAF